MLNFHCRLRHNLLHDIAGPTCGLMEVQVRKRNINPKRQRKAIVTHFWMKETRKYQKRVHSVLKYLVDFVSNWDNEKDQLQSHTVRKTVETTYLKAKATKLAAATLNSTTTPLFWMWTQDPPSKRRHLPIIHLQIRTACMGISFSSTRQVFQPFPAQKQTELKQSVSKICCLEYKFMVWSIADFLETFVRYLYVCWWALL